MPVQGKQITIGMAGFIELGYTHFLLETNNLEDVFQYLNNEASTYISSENREYFAQQISSFQQELFPSLRP